MTRTVYTPRLSDRVHPATRIASLFVLFVALLTAFRLDAQTTISSVDTSLNGSQKYTLRVGNTPFYPISIQMRFDKLRYFNAYKFTFAQCNALAAQAASDGFNTIKVPLTWYEVEPTKDTFDWTVLDNYLSIANNNNLKMELLWLGVNDDGGTGWEGDSGNPVHLRTPDYVLYAPSYGSTATTSDYTILSGYPFTLDVRDANLQARETYVLSQVMAHIASWDAANGNMHPVIGFQIENETQRFSASAIVSYMSGVASAIKTSNYSVYTRTNTIDNQALVESLAAYNQTLRNGAGTNLDFIGIDNYSSSPTVIEGAQPVIANNYAMIMENNAQNPATVKLAALAGNTSLNSYDMCGPDGYGLYTQTSPGVCTPTGSNITGVRAMNHMLASDTVDLALNAQGKGLFVHNWAANSTSTTTGGSLGISYTPTTTNDQAVSIQRSNTEIVLMNTGGGTFTIPAELNVSAASQGYFDANNSWVDQGAVPFTSASITPTAGTTVRLTYVLPVPVAPTGLNVVTAGSGQVALTWNAASYATSYNVKRGTSSAGPFTTIASGITSTSYTDTSVTNGTTYYYVVSAVNASGESSNSSSVTATPSANVIVVGNYSFEAPTTTNYIYNPSGGSWTFSGASPSGAGVSANGGNFTSGNAVAPSGLQVAFLQETGTITQTLTGFTPGTSYTVTFMASQRVTVGSGTQVGQTFDVRLDGNTIASFNPPQGTASYTLYSASFTATAASHTLSFVGTDHNGGDNTVFLDDVQVSVTTPTSPASPTNPIAWYGDKVVSLTWTAGTGATSYNVKRATTSGGPYTVLASPSSTTFTDTTVTDGTTYYYVVSSVNAAGESANSSEVSASPVIGMIMVPNYSFEYPNTTTYAYNASGGWWTFSGASPSGSGVTTNGSHFTSGNAVAPNGTQVGFVQENGTLSQALNGFVPGTTYTISFMASQRQTVGSGSQAGQTFDLRVDGTTIASFAPPQSSASYGTYTATFTATQASHTISFVGTDHNSGDNTVFLDNIQVHQ